MELLIVRNPDPESSLPYLLRLPVGGQVLLFKVRETWPRTAPVYCHRVSLDEWPEEPDIVEQSVLRSCERRGRAIDIVLDRARENRSELVFTNNAKQGGREVVFWNTARTRRQARPGVRVPSARAGGVAALEITVDTRERYAYRFADQEVTVVKRALACGDYGITHQGQLVAAVERKSLSDLVTSLTGGRLGYALADLAALPRAAVVVEDRYSAVFKLTRVRPAVVADGLAELQVRYPNVPVFFAESRKLAEEYIYRLLAAARVWADGEEAAVRRIGVGSPETAAATTITEPTTAELRAWAREHGLDVPDRGRLRPDIRQAWHAARQTRGHGLRDISEDAT
ncbi:ERCC4 domain-containing protein [Streptomyces sp. NBC_01304]|uniref:ERCC4 domain-containing protein n=1 Tax=Streptomyces sp. NBC_01304 TaxID=2903818 RepID=UPI002E116B65|nr:Lsr2 family protein [Streptomyces sp. NBC_01304]